MTRKQRISRKRHGRLSADAIAGWLSNVEDRLRHDISTKDNDARQIAAFVLVHTCRTCRKLVGICPSASSDIGSHVIDSLLHFDCGWQLALLHRFEGLEQKIKHMYPMVWMAIDNAIEALAAERSEFAAVFGPYLQQGEENRREGKVGAIKLYIWGERSQADVAVLAAVADRGIVASEDLRIANALVFTNRLALRLGGLGASGTLPDDFVQAMLECASGWWDDPMLKQFDLAECLVVEWPDEFYDA